MSKLTLSVDPEIAGRAKAYAKGHGVSVSEMVETYLESVLKADRPNRPDPPGLHALRGSLKHGTVADYRKYLERKYK